MNLLEYNITDYERVLDHLVDILNGDNGAQAYNKILEQAGKDIPDLFIHFFNGGIYEPDTNTPCEEIASLLEFWRKPGDAEYDNIFVCTKPVVKSRLKGWEHYGYYYLAGFRIDSSHYIELGVMLFEYLLDALNLRS